MASNRLPDSLPDLLHLASNAQAGAAALGGDIPLVLNTSSAIGGARSSVVQTHAAFRTSVSELPAVRTALKDARREGRAFAMKARKWLENSLGSKHTLAWSAVGFDHHSLQIPKDDAGIEALLEMMHLYFTNNPDQENEDPRVNVTAARARAFCLALGSAVGNCNSKEQECGTKKAARDKVVRTLRKRLRGLIQELAQNIEGDDPRWRRFGLNLPSAPNVPAVPKNVAVNTNTAEEFFITCPPAQYASHYRFFTQLPGVDAEPVLVGSSDEPMFHLTALTPGTTFEIYVTAANLGAESRFSKVVTAVVSEAEEAAA